VAELHYELHLQQNAQEKVVRLNHAHLRGQDIRGKSFSEVHVAKSLLEVILPSTKYFYFSKTCSLTFCRRGISSLVSWSPHLSNMTGSWHCQSWSPLVLKNKVATAGEEVEAAEAEAAEVAEAAEAAEAEAAEAEAAEAAEAEAEVEPAAVDLAQAVEMEATG
jgi:hypothetical protein